MPKKSVRPGDGHPLPRFRWWQLFSRSVFHLRVAGADGSHQTWTVDVRHGGDSNGNVLAKLYRDGVHEATSKLPAQFIMPGGRIEVVVSDFGIKRCHYITQDGEERQLGPDPASAEGRRARLDRAHPVLSRAMGSASLIVLVVALVLGVPQIIDEISHIPPIAESIGTFESPVHLPAGANISLVVATLVASTERALRLRYNRVLDGGLFTGIE